MAGSIPLDVPTGDLGGLRVVGSDDLGRIFVDVFLVERPVPLQVRREVWILDDSGAVLGRIPIPTHYFTRIFRDLELQANGDLHHMVSAEDGIHVFRWEVGDISGGGYLGELPRPFPDQGPLQLRCQGRITRSRDLLLPASTNPRPAP